jgi:transcriptional regulator with XRE-family HTH domain
MAFPVPDRKTDSPKRGASRTHLKDLTPAFQLRYVIDTFPLSREKLAQLLGVSPRTINRWAKSGAGPERREHVERLSRIHEIIELGVNVYTQKGLRDFFKTALQEFEHRTAFDMLAIGKFDAVLGALAADFEGLGS